MDYFTSVHCQHRRIWILTLPPMLHYFTFQIPGVHRNSTIPPTKSTDAKNSNMVTRNNKSEQYSVLFDSTELPGTQINTEILSASAPTRTVDF